MKYNAILTFVHVLCLCLTMKVLFATVKALCEGVALTNVTSVMMATVITLVLVVLLCVFVHKVSCSFNDDELWHPMGDDDDDIMTLTWMRTLIPTMIMIMVMFILLSSVFSVYHGVLCPMSSIVCWMRLLKSLSSLIL